MTQTEQLAAFVQRASDAELAELARTRLKASLLDAVGCAIGALVEEPPARPGSSVDAVEGLEGMRVRGLTGLLGSLSTPRR